MPNFRLTVTEIATIAGQRRVRCAPGGAPPAGPGQFYRVRPPDPAALGRRPAFPVLGAAGLDFWAAADDPLAALEPGLVLDADGPWGRAAGWLDRPARLLMVSAGLPRLWPVLEAALGRAWAVTWLWPGDLPADLLSVLPPAVEVVRGPATHDLAEWAEAVVLDVPEPEAWARRLRSWAPLRGADFIRAVRVPELPCGFGGCQACWAETRSGRRLACVDGPLVVI